MLVRLGSFQFSVSTLAYQSVASGYNWRWDVINVINSDQVLQYAGKGDETIRLTGITHPIYGGGAPITELRLEAERKEPLWMVAANGEVLGRYVVESIQYDESNFHKSGLAHQANFTISIRRFIPKGNALQF